jgi:hypothetical protein
MVQSSSMKNPLLFMFVVLLPFAACGRDDSIKTYRLAREPVPLLANNGAAPVTQPVDAPPGSSSMPAIPGMEAAASSSDIGWTVPKGWKSQPPSAMRVGSFLITGKDGQQADVSVVPLSGDAGGDLANINRWRDQIELRAMNEDELARELKTRSLGGHTYRMIDFVSDRPLINGQHKKRVVAGIVTHGEQTWFFKMVGEDQLVSASKDEFNAFLASVRFKDAGR